MSESSEPIVAVLCCDLFFASQIEGTARDYSVPCEVAASLEKLFALIETGTIRRVIIDLEFPGLDPRDLMSRMPTESRPFILGFGPHVKTEQLANARAAGFDSAIARSRFSSDLAAILQRATSGPDATR